MFAVIFLFRALNTNFLIGFVSESVGLLIFGVVLFAFAAGLRRILKLSKERENIHQTASGVHRSEDF